MTSASREKRNPNADNGPFYRKKQRKKFFSLPGCPECALKGRYVEFLPVSLRSVRKCPRCGAVLEYRWSGRSAWWILGVSAVALGVNIALIAKLQSVITLLIFTFCVILLASFFLPLTMEVKCVKKPRKK